MKRYYIKKNKLDEEKSFFTVDDINIENDKNPVQAEAEKIYNAPNNSKLHLFHTRLDGQGG